MDPDHMLACGEREVFEEDILTDSQLVAALNVPIQDDPAVPARSLEVEALPNLWIFCAGQLWSLTLVCPVWRSSSKDKRTPVSLQHLLSLPSVRDTPGRSSSHGSTSQSLVTRGFRSLCWRLRAEPATKTP